MNARSKGSRLWAAMRLVGPAWLAGTIAERIGGHVSLVMRQAATQR